MITGVSGAGQSNLSTGVAALLHDQLLSVPVQQEEPDDPDFLELDFDPSSEDGESSNDSGQGREEVDDDLMRDPPLLTYQAAKSPSPLRLVPELLPMDVTPLDRVSPRSVPSRRASQNSIRENVASVSPELFLPLAPVPSKESKSRNFETVEISLQNNNNAVEDVAKTSKLDEVPCVSCDSRSSQPLYPDAIKPSSNVTEVRSVPLTSPAEDIPSLNMPRSKSLNNNISNCMAAENSMKEDENLLVCGNMLMLREALLFKTENCDLNTALARLSIPGEKSLTKFPRAMIWTEKEAYRNNVTQLGISACGATAIANVLLALNYSFNEEELLNAVKTRTRREKSDVADYLLSRSVAGTNHIDLIAGVETLCGDRITGRFFPMHKRKVSLTGWLASWMSRGCIPVATLNLQRAEVESGMRMQDSWHHQMIWGVAGKDVYLTNNLEVVSENVLMPQLDSPSELLIRCEDITSRFSSSSDISPLAGSDMDAGYDERWQTFNVLGQVVNILREQRSVLNGDVDPCAVTGYVKIPACYESGITLFCDNADPELSSFLLSAADLPFRENSL